MIKKILKLHKYGICKDMPSLIKNLLYMKELEEKYEPKELARFIVDLYDPEIRIHYNFNIHKKLNCLGAFNNRDRIIYIATPDRYKNAKNPFALLYFIHTILHELGHANQDDKGELDKHVCLAKGQAIVDIEYLEEEADAFARNNIDLIIKECIKNEKRNV